MTLEIPMFSARGRVAALVIVVLAFATSCGQPHHRPAPVHAAPSTQASPTTLAPPALSPDQAPARAGVRPVGTDAMSRATFRLAGAIAALRAPGWRETMIGMHAAIAGARIAYVREVRAVRAPSTSCAAVASLVQTIRHDAAAVAAGYTALEPVFASVSVRLDALSAATSGLEFRAATVHDRATRKAVGSALVEGASVYHSVLTASVDVSARAAQLWSAAYDVQGRAQQLAARACG